MMILMIRVSQKIGSTVWFLYLRKYSLVRDITRDYRFLTRKIDNRRRERTVSAWSLTLLVETFRFRRKRKAEHTYTCAVPQLHLDTRARSPRTARFSITNFPRDPGKTFPSLHSVFSISQFTHMSLSLSLSLCLSLFHSFSLFLKCRHLSAFSWCTLTLVSCRSSNSYSSPEDFQRMLEDTWLKFHQILFRPSSSII